MQGQEQSAECCRWPQGPTSFSALTQAFCSPSARALVSLLPGVEDGAVGICHEDVRMKDRVALD